VAHPVFKTGGARQTALEGSTPSPFRMSDRDRLRDLPSVDRLATAVARAELQARREELLTGTDAGAGEAVDLVARDPAVVARLHDGRLLLDPRTLTDEEAGEVARAALP
jgi:hypothetical protein